MDNSLNPRREALDILNNMELSKSYSNIEINNMIISKNVSMEDKNLVSKLVYGVTENKILIDYYIKSLSKVKLKKINYKVLNILRLGVYQIEFLDKIPDSAAVNEAVKLTKKVNYKSSGFVNGILRNFIRNREKLKLPDFKENPEEYLSIKYSHPLWLIKRWNKEYGIEFTENLLKGNNKKPPLSLRVNTLKITRDKLIEKLNGEGIESSKSFKSEDGLIVEKLSINNMRNNKSYNEGLFIIQDESSMMVAENLDVKSGMTVIDVCAAPGGKTTHIAQKMNNEGKILAFDIYEHKINLIRDNYTRLGIHIIEEKIQDATLFNDEFFQIADRVLVDAPCSGFGIIRRKPEIKFSKTEDDIINLSKLQLDILNNASKYLKDDGILLYSTCSIEPLEDENVIELFLKENQNFSLLGNGNVKFFPNVDDTDGFFISKLIKRG